MSVSGRRVEFVISPFNLLHGSSPVAMTTGSSPALVAGGSSTNRRSVAPSASASSTQNVTVSYHPATWMQDIDSMVHKAQQQGSGGGGSSSSEGSPMPSLFAQLLSLNTLTMVGTHDSATDKITNKSMFSPDRVGVQKAVPNFVHGVTKSIISDWSKCQSRDLFEQLSDGVRYLDLRVTPRLEEIPAELASLLMSQQGGTGSNGLLEPGARIVYCSPEQLSAHRAGLGNSDQMRLARKGTPPTEGGSTPTSPSPPPTPNNGSPSDRPMMIRIWTAHGQYSEPFLNCAQHIRGFMQNSHRQHMPSEGTKSSPYAQEMVLADIQHFLGFDQFSAWLTEPELHAMVLECLRPIEEYLVPARPEDSERDLSSSSSYYHVAAGGQGSGSGSSTPPVPTPLDLLSMPLASLWEWHDVHSRQLIPTVSGKNTALQVAGDNGEGTSRTRPGRGGVIVLYKHQPAAYTSYSVIRLNTTQTPSSTSHSLNLVHSRQPVSGSGVRGQATGNLPSRTQTVDSNWFNQNELKALRSAIVTDRDSKSKHCAALCRAQHLPPTLLAEDPNASGDATTTESSLSNRPSVSFLYDTAQRLQRPLHVSQSVLTPNTSSVVTGILVPKAIAKYQQIRDYALAGNSTLLADFRDYYIETASKTYVHLNTPGAIPAFRTVDNSFRNVLMLDFYELGTCFSPWAIASSSEVSPSRSGAAVTPASRNGSCGGASRQVSASSVCIELNMVPFLEMVLNSQLRFNV